MRMNELVWVLACAVEPLASRRSMYEAVQCVTCLLYSGWPWMPITCSPTRKHVVFNYQLQYLVLVAFDDRKRLGNHLQSPQELGSSQPVRHVHLPGPNVPPSTSLPHLPTKCSTQYLQEKKKKKKKNKEKECTASATWKESILSIDQPRNSFVSWWPKQIPSTLFCMAFSVCSRKQSLRIPQIIAVNVMWASTPGESAVLAQVLHGREVALHHPGQVSGVSFVPEKGSMNTFK